MEAPSSSPSPSSSTPSTTTTATSSSSSYAPPRLRYTYRSKNGVQVNWGPPEIKKDERIFDPTATYFVYSRDGSRIVLLNPTSVTVRDTKTSDIITSILRPNILSVALSPKNSYLLTFERFDKQSQAPNLIVWDKTGQQVVSFPQKSQAKWPSLKWSNDEAICGRIVSNEIHFYEKGNFKDCVNRIKLPFVEAFSFGPGSSPYRIAAFFPEKKGDPAGVLLYDYPLLTAAQATKRFYKADTVDFLWNCYGNYLIISSHTDVDRSGKSYYGEDGLHFMDVKGRTETITLAKEGPIHECAWNPNGKEFAVIYGYMPAKTTLFSAECKPKADFGTAPRNTLRWSPNGKLLCVAGFGNLQGEMDIWDPQELKKVGVAIAHCAAHCEWAPDGFHILTAILSPRHRVDNGLKIWNFDGTLIYEESFNELYQVGWQPASPGIFPNRPYVLTKSIEPSNKTSTPQPSAPAKYRHPNFTGAAVASRKDEEGPQKYPEQPKAKKKKSKKPQPSTPPANVSTIPNQQTTSSFPSSLLDGEGEPDTQKQIKNLTKKLREISNLKEQQKNGKQLTENQLSKIAMENQIKSQLNSL